jgi:hypothetical protein
MERDAAIAHGASAFLLARLMYDSDKYMALFCTKCGEFAENKLNKAIRCPICEEDTHIGRTYTPYAYKFLKHNLGGMGLNLHSKFKTLDEYASELLNAEMLIPEEEVDQNEYEKLEQEDFEDYQELEEIAFDEIYDE